MSYQQLYEEFIASLKSSADIKIVKNDFYSKDELLPKLFESHPFLNKIEDEVMALNDNHVYWEFKDQSSFQPGGEFHLMEIGQIISSQIPSIKSSSSDERRLLLELKPFDDHPQSGDGVMGCISFAKTDHEIWLQDGNREFTRMNLDLSGYLQEMFRLKAIYGWQHLFTDALNGKPKSSVIKKSLSSSLRKLASLFPASDFQSFLNLVEK